MSTLNRTSRMVMLGTLLLLLAFTTGCSAAKVAVPSVVGKPSAEATATIISAKLKVGVGTQDYSNTVPVGSVISQVPAAGAEAPEGSEVVASVSKGKAPVRVPDVSGQNVSGATAAMGAAGLSILTYDEYVAGTPKGVAFTQLPAAGTDTRAGSAAIVGFSLGDPPTNPVVPSVVGKSSASAIAALRQGGFKVVTRSQHVVGAKAGTVIAQVPIGGAKAAPGSSVIVMSSSGSPSGSVPDVSGMSRQKAGATLNDGFAPSVFELVNGKVPRGVVYAQVPAAGTTQLYGSDSVFVVSLGDPGEAVPLQTPDVSNMSEPAARAAITAAGFVPYVIHGHDPRVAKGLAATQVPVAGAYAIQGQDVVVMISRGPISTATRAVPSLVGKTSSRAVSALNSAGLNADISKLFSTTAPKGTVMGQLPKAGARVISDSDVVMVVSLGKPPSLGITIPPLIGVTEEKASAQLDDLGLSTISLVGPPAPQRIGTVMAQFPKPGTKVKVGAQVVLAIAP